MDKRAIKELNDKMIGQKISELVSNYSLMYKAARGNAYRIWSRPLLQQIKDNMPKAKKIITSVYDEYISQVSAQASFKSFLDIFSYNKIRRGNIEIDFRAVEPEVTKGLFDIYFSSAVAGAEEFTKKFQIKTSFSPADHYSIDYYKWLTDTRKKYLLDTDKSILSNILDKANKTGMSKREVQKLIIEKLSDTANINARAESIAVTETTTSLNWAKYKSGLNSETRMIKVWLTAEDDLVRPSHLALDNVEVGMEDDFITGDGNICKHPGDPALPAGDVINCRCSFSMYPEDEGR